MLLLEVVKEEYVSVYMFEFWNCIVFKHMSHFICTCKITAENMTNSRMKTNRRKSAETTQIRISMNEYMFRVMSDVHSRSWNDMGLGNYAVVLHLGTMRSSFT